MKAAYAAIIGVLALFFSACVSGDEITSYVIEPDGAVAFSIYRLNLTSDQTGEDAKNELANYIQELEEKKDDPFTGFAKANAEEVKVTVLRATSPASVLIAGRFPSLEDFAAYISGEDKDSGPVCTPISTEHTRGLLFELTQGVSEEEANTGITEARADSMNETRFALAEGIFTKSEGFLLAHDKRSAILDEDASSKILNSKNPITAFSLEWQIPEAP